MKKLIKTLALIAIGVAVGRVTTKHRKETAFQFSIENGFAGTMEDWIGSLKG